jgi:hypothetical protein
MMNLLVILLVFWVILMIVAYIYNLFVGPMFGRVGALAPVDIALLMLLVIVVVWAANHFNYWGRFTV